MRECNLTFVVPQFIDLETVTSLLIPNKKIKTITFKFKQYLVGFKLIVFIQIYEALQHNICYLNLRNLCTFRCNHLPIYIVVVVVLAIVVP